MTFAAPENLIYLWFLPLIAVLLVLAHRRRVARVQRIAGAAGRSAQVSTGRVVLKGVLLASAFGLATLALARPQWGFEWQTIRTTGADVVIAVDVSQSMLATDIDPSRLERAKREVIDLLGLMRGDRVALVAFAGEAYVQCPLTEDYAAARMFINYLDASLVPVQGTDLGKAIRVATEALVDGGPESSAGRAIILITDGEDQEGNAKAAAAEAKAKGIKLFTIGIGSAEGAPIPLASGGFKKDGAGNMVVTKPDERVLQELAVDTGGIFVRSVAGDMDLQKIYSQGILQGVERGELGETRKKQWFERFQWFLAAAFVLLVLESLVRDVVFKVSGAGGAGLALLFALAAGSRAEASTLKDAHDAYDAAQYDKAAQGFLSEEAERPDDPELTYNRAVSQYKQGKLDDAARGFDKAAKAESPELKERSLFNLGNSYAGLSKYDEAIKAFEGALAVKPGDKETEENLAAVKKLKEMQQQQQQKQDQQKKDQGSDDKKQEEPQKSDQGSDQKDKQEKQDGQPKPGDDKQEPQQQAGSGSGSDSQPEDKQTASQPDQKQSKPGDKGSEEKKPDDAQEQAQNGSGSDEKEPAKPAEKAASKDHKTAAEQADAQQAEQVLRSVDDQARKYLGMPKTQKKPRVVEKDW